MSKTTGCDIPIELRKNIQCIPVRYKNIQRVTGYTIIHATCIQPMLPGNTQKKKRCYLAAVAGYVGCSVEIGYYLILSLA